MGARRGEGREYAREGEGKKLAKGRKKESIIHYIYSSLTVIITVHLLRFHIPNLW